MNLSDCKQVLRAFLRDEALWPTPKLCGLLAWAQDGKLRYSYKCQCLIGILSSITPHLLCEGGHYDRSVPEFQTQEDAFYCLGFQGGRFSGQSGQSYPEVRAQRDSLRRRLIIPMIRAVLKERERIRRNTTDHEQQGVAEQPLSAACERRPGGIQPERPMKSTGSPRPGQEVCA